MSDNNKIQLFEDQPIRTAWEEEAEEVYVKAYASFFNSGKRF